MDGNPFELAPDRALQYYKTELTYLTDSEELRENLAKAFILSRLGYSHSGASNWIGVTRQTVSGYYDELEEMYGENALLAMNSPDEDILKPVKQ